MGCVFREMGGCVAEFRVFGFSFARAAQPELRPTRATGGSGWNGAHRRLIRGRVESGTRGS
jgi:hypothetical protein